VSKGYFLESPLQIKVSLTNICNFKCLMCYNPKLKGRRGYIQDRLVEKIIQECAREGINRISLGGTGEPLLHPRAVDYIALAKSAGLWVSTTTNATFLTRDKADALLEAGLDRLGLSIYSSNPREHNQYTGTETFNQVSENIKYFLERWAQTGRRTKVLLRFLAIPGVNDYQAYLRYWKPITDRVGLDLAVKEPINWAGQIDLYGRGGWLGFSLERPESGASLVRRGKVPCPHLRYYLHVVHTGRVLPCCNIFEPEEAEELVFGDLNRETITSIWRSDRYLAFKEDLYHLRAEEYLPCRSCSEISKVKLRLPLSPRAITSRVAARLTGRAGRPG